MASLGEEEAPVVELPRLVSGSVVSVDEREGNGRSRFIFELNLSWSDGSESIIFRGYQDFYDFHCQLLDLFPEESGSIKGSERIIPFLPGKQVFRRSTKNLALQRLPKLHQYLQEILSLPSHLLSSTVSLAFFRDNWEEEKSKYFPPPKIEEKSKINNSDSRDTPDDLLRSIEAVKMDDEFTVRYQRNSSPQSDSSDDVLNDIVGSNEYKPMLNTMTDDDGSFKGRGRVSSYSGEEHRKGSISKKKDSWKGGSWKGGSWKGSKRKSRSENKYSSDYRRAINEDEARKNGIEDSQEGLLQ